MPVFGSSSGTGRNLAPPPRQIVKPERRLAAGLRCFWFPAYLVVILSHLAGLVTGLCYCSKCDNRISRLCAFRVGGLPSRPKPATSRRSGGSAKLRPSWRRVWKTTYFRDWHDLKKVNPFGISRDTCRKFNNAALAVVLAAMVAGCETLNEHSFTGELWRKDPTATIADSAQGKDHLYRRFARTTLKPFAIAADATVVAAVIGSGCVMASFAEACREGARNCGRVCY